MKLRNVVQELSKSEVYQAAQAGVMRRIASMQNGNNKNIHAYKSDWATDIDGACAELAVAKYYGVYWEPSVNTFHKQSDVSNGYEVRSTPKPDGCLIVRGNDKEDRTYILVICDSPTSFRLVGSKKVTDCKVDRFYRKGDQLGRNAWFVPQDALDDLPSKDFRE